MSGGFLLDEHLPRWWRNVVTRWNPGLLIRYVGDPSAPALHTPDDEILLWCEAFDAMLMTNNRSTMPIHLGDHLASGRHIPGIFLIDPSLDANVLAHCLAYIVGASLPNEYQDQILYLPLITP